MKNKLKKIIFKKKILKQNNFYIYIYRFFFIHINEYHYIFLLFNKCISNEQFLLQHHHIHHE